jgi:hypothetical protein
MKEPEQLRCAAQMGSLRCWRPVMEMEMFFMGSAVIAAYL